MKPESEKFVKLIEETSKIQPNILEAAKSYAKSLYESYQNGVYENKKDIIKSFKKDICKWNFIREAEYESKLKLRNVNFEEVVDYFRKLKY